HLYQRFYDDDNCQQMVFPGMVYISYPTEYGTLYSKEELTDLATVCHQHHLTLYIDGARLGYGLVSPEADLTIKDIAQLADVFYIGGTKIGALCGEAVVFTKNNEPEHFYSFVKQHGALLAKGRLNSLQFLELFSDNLYFDISQHAVDLALKLKQGFLDKGYQLYLDSPTNQQFFIVDNQKVQELSEQVLFTRWEKYDETHTVLRFVTSWATPSEDVERLLELV
ncbi:low specificity L-threonine aldolase, partial [Lactobacillus sp. XV13L]|nr:low specificity L-threonine aldolase [Lactobacillus sp. XV13L]